MKTSEIVGLMEWLLSQTIKIKSRKFLHLKTIFDKTRTEN
jgi:hypothetical protein